MIELKDIQGNQLLSVSITQSCQNVEELMAADYIQLSWNSDLSDELPLGAYIEHNGERYSLLEPYKPTQKDESEYTYTPKFESRVRAWGKKPFFFYSGQSKEPDWTLTSNPADFMRCVCDAIREETGESWTYSIDASLPASASLSFSSSDILSGLNQIASAFETEWYADKETNTLYLGLLSHGSEVTLEVGKNISVPSVQSSKEGYYTRFYAFGSTRNITQDYTGSNTNNLVNKRLTLDPNKYPNGYKDIRDGLSEGEIFSKVLIFDDVYPSAKLSISGVRSRLMYRLDESGNKIQLGTDDSGNPIYDQYTIWYFRIEGFAFDWENVIDGLTPSISFQSGTLNGREFEIIYYNEDKKITTSDGIVFEAKQGDYEIKFIEENNLIIPAMTGLVPSDGDEVVLFNIKMPSEYTQSAYVELERELDKAITRMTSDLSNYSFKSNPVAFNESNPNLSIGRKVRYVNGSYSYSTRVIKLTTQIDFPIEQSITIGNEKVKGNTQQLKEEVASANKDLNLLAVFNDMTQTIQQSYNRTQQMMLDGFAAIKNIWQIRETENGEKYIFSAFDVATQKGVTMYADEGLLDLPSIYDGLPIDMDTLYWVLDENGKKLYLKVKGGEGNGSFGEIETLGEGNAITKVEVIEGGEGEADKLVFTKEKTFIDKELLEKDYLTKAYIEENYYTKKTTDETFFKKDDAKGLFVTLDETTQEILGVKTFKNGLNIGSSKIWQSQNDVVYVDANLVVRGGVTMYGLNKVDVPTIMAGVAVDDVTISKKNGYLEVVGGGGGSIEYPLSWSGFSSGSYDGTSSKTIYIPSKLSELTDDLSKYLPLTGGTLTGNLTVNGVFNAKGTKVYMPTGSDGRGFAFAGQYMYVHWDYSSWERIFHLDGNNRIVLSLIPQITGVGLLADRPWVGQNYVSELGLAQDSSGTFNQYLTYTKNGVVNKISVGYAGYATGLKAWSTSDLSSSGVWNTVIGMRTAFFASNASNIPVAAGTNANGLITFMPVYNYGFQLAYLNQLSTGYESIPHLYFRNYVNGSYKSWYRIVTNGPQMAFEGVNWDNPYMRMRYQSGDWYYVQMRSDGMWLGLSNTKGVNINSEGRLYTTGHISVGSVYTRGNIVLSDHSIYFKSSVSSGSSNWRIVGYGSGLQFNYASYTTDPETATYTGILQLNSTKITAKTDLVCTGGITMYGTSDQRLKQNIRSFSASEELMKLGGVYQFEYVEEEVKRNYKYKGTHFGLIYQNVKGTSLAKMCMEREDGFGALNYLDTSFISLLAAVGMEHETRLQRLERENMELRMEVEQLKNK